LPFEKKKREILIKRELTPCKEYGTEPDKRPIPELIKYGIINVDKPKGPTSHQVSAYLQKIMGVNKGGHSGTLDPGVTGVLPVAIERATRVVQAILNAGKEYVCLMNLHKEISEYEIYKLCEGFTGKIEQMPPVRSAVKRQLRTREIYYIDILEIENGRNILFKVGCQGGTYIRKLVHDMGIKAGSGAHMAELRRTKAGPIDESTAFTLQDISDALYFYKEEGNERFLRKVVQPMENAVKHLPMVWVADTTINPLCHGSNLCIPGVARFHSGINKDDIIAVMSLKDELVALGTAVMISEDIQKAEKGVCVRIDKVFMEPGTYPKYIK